MEVGDSFMVEVEGNTRQEAVRVFASASSWGRSRGIKFLRRNVPGGFRIWRIK